MSATLSGKGRWSALIAAILGWLFDGLEMGLFPLVAHPALSDLLQTSDAGQIGKWYGVITAGFLVGAATGGVLFGWLGDRIGRVRAMALSIFVYAVFSGLCGFANSATMLLLLRFIASLGMGGEWSLGVSLVMELWPSQSRGWLAGLIGAAANVGFVLIAIVGMVLNQVLTSVVGFLEASGLPQSQVDLLASHGGWRILMILSALPALLTFLIRLFVPESERWLHEHGKGATSHWATADLMGVLVGCLGPLGMIYLWARDDVSLALRAIGSLIGLGIAIAGYMYPVTRYLQRSGRTEEIRGAAGQPVRKLMLVGAALSGVALLGTWGSMQLAAPWAAELNKVNPVANAKEWTQIALGIGAIIGTIIAAIVGHKFGRRITYAALCVMSLASVQVFYLTNDSYGAWFLFSGFVGGGITAAFYGWLPLYLPELFPTRVRATGQGFAYNFGRILAAVGTLQTGALMSQVFDGSFPKACSVMSCIYLVGVVIIWFAPETRDEEFLG
jgi:MFS family permease